MGKRSLLVVAVVLVGVALWRLALDQDPVPDAAPPNAPSAPAAPEAQRDPQPVTQPATPTATAENKPETKPQNQAAAATPPQAPGAPQQADDNGPVPTPSPSGPIAALKQAFESEPRDSAAQVPESRIESEFRKGDIAPGTLKSVLCRKSVCRVEVLWTPERATSFIAAFTRLSSEFEPDLAIDPHGTPSTGQQTQIDVYLPRMGSGTKPPAEH